MNVDDHVASDRDEEIAHIHEHEIPIQIDTQEQKSELQYSRHHPSIGRLRIHHEPRDAQTLFIWNHIRHRAALKACIHTGRHLEFARQVSWQRTSLMQELERPMWARPNDDIEPSFTSRALDGFERRTLR